MLAVIAVVVAMVFVTGRGGTGQGRRFLGTAVLVWAALAALAIVALTIATLIFGRCLRTGLRSQTDARRAMRPCPDDRWHPGERAERRCQALDTGPECGSSLDCSGTTLPMASNQPPGGLNVGVCAAAASRSSAVSSGVSEI